MSRGSFPAVCVGHWHLGAVGSGAVADNQKGEPNYAVWCPDAGV